MAETTENQAAAAPFRVAFVLMPRFSMLPFSAGLEPLRMANRQSERALYSWQILSLDGAPTAASNGILVNADSAIGDADPADLYLVCGGEQGHAAPDKRLASWLRKLAQRKVSLGALCTGTYALAQADLLDGYRCTVHWENIASLREQNLSLLGHHVSRHLITR